ncbi:hypothetical protein [Actinoallomurus bryophytorum]|uniref:hypothetical protein n=1 Tax=Actinoallomurus bryophytorum TaxID=1490222 RepID=UPI00114FDBA8|nr:hypothetical protein [Actinoallomurus bryophytorum]
MSAGRPLNIGGKDVLVKRLRLAAVASVALVPALFGLTACGHSHHHVVHHHVVHHVVHHRHH